MTLAASPKMLTIRQVAETLGCSDDTVERAIKAGQLKALHVGRKHARRRTWRIRQHDLDRFLNSRETSKR